jgi:Mn-dependent DtxR family transcriptional regulator
MRTYVSKIDSNWSTDLTTNELAARLGPLAPAAAPLLAVLARADLVKFARHRPVSSEANGDLVALRQWVTTFEKPLPRLAEAA